MTSGGSTDMDDIRRVLAGDVDAFAELVKRHQDYVARIVRRHVPPDRVAETVQDALVRAYQSLGGFRRTESFRQWLSAISVRTCYDFWRRRYRRREVAVSQLSEAHQQWLEKFQAQDAGDTWQELSDRAEAREILDAAMARLSPEDRMVIELVHLEERPVAEAARLLGWSRTNVKVRAFRARKRLHQIILGGLP